MIRGNGELPRAPQEPSSLAERLRLRDRTSPGLRITMAVSFRETSNPTYCFIVMSSRWYRDQSATSEATGICCSNYVIVWNIDPSAG